MKIDLENRLLQAKAKITINRIIEAVKFNENKDIHETYALEKFQNYASKYNLPINEKESEYMQRLVVQMYDNKGKFSLSLDSATAKKEEFVKSPTSNIVSINSAKAKPKY